jgi:undecaprenyl-diphosphatase
MPLIVLLVLACAAGAGVAVGSSKVPRGALTEGVVEAAAGRRSRWQARLDPEAATGLALTAALAMVLAGGLLIGLLALLIRSKTGLVRLDHGIDQWGADHATDNSTDVIQIITDVGDVYGASAALIACAVVETIRRPSRWIVPFLAVVALGQVALSSALKEVFDRVRPTFNPIASTLGPSFPSGHSCTAAAVYAAIALVLSRGRSRRARAGLAGAAVAIAVAVASSRVLLGVHWPSDVIAGLALGWAWFAACSIAFGGRLLQFGRTAERVAAVDHARAAS